MEASSAHKPELRFRLFGRYQLAQDRRNFRTSEKSALFSILGRSTWKVWERINSWNYRRLCGLYAARVLSTGDRVWQAICIRFHLTLGVSSFQATSVSAAVCIVPSKSFAAMSKAIPKFSELPLRAGDPPHSAWGIYGPDDELGTVNRLTKEVVLAAKDEIRTGDRFSLNWPLNKLSHETFVGRDPFHLKQWTKHPRIVNDDIWTFNSQCCTQWDGLRHFAYQKEGKFYNGVTLHDMFHENGAMKSNVNGIEKWERKGIVGRGILLDYDRWHRGQEISYNALLSNGSEPSSIPLEHLKAVLEFQGTEVRFGDILVVRTGFTAAWEGASTAEREAASQLMLGSGLSQSLETLEWLWDHFAAVAGDHVSFEKWPSEQSWYMHEVLLAGWGMPIGEMFDLEGLAQHCEKVNRWSFFLTSEVS